MGRIFKVLVQHKGIDAPRLRGLSLRASPRALVGPDPATGA
jgi:hypothetical protein